MKWLHCSGCQWAGNTLDAYSKILHTPDTKTVIQQAIREGICTGPQHISPETIRSYVREYPERRGELLRIWDYVTSNVRGAPRPDVMRHLQHCGLWAGGGSRIQERLSRFVGAATKTELKKAFGIYYKRADQKLIAKLPENGYQTALVISYQDAPGRICAFELIDRNEDRFLKMMPGSAEHVGEGGLAVLDSIKPFEPMVLVVDDPKVWLALQLRQARQFDTPFKALLYNHHTDLAWRSVTAEKTVFWVRDINVDVFKHARKVSNGCIISSPWYYTPGGIESSLATHPLPRLWGELDRRARTWPEVFVDWATAPARAESEAVQALEQLGLTPGERDALLSVATPQQQHKLKNLLGSTSRARTVSVNGVTVLEQDGSWYVVRARHNELILDGTLSVAEELCDSHNGISYMRGVIRYRGKELQYTDPTPTIERNPEAWLTGYTVKAGLGSPRCNPKFSKQLLDIARAFSEIRVRQISTDLGILSDGTIAFPRFTLSGGAPTEADHYNPDPAMPMALVMPPVRRTADTRDTTSLTRSTVIAGFCALVSNWLEQHRGNQNHPVAVVGDSGSVAWSAVRHLAAQLGLPRLHLDYGRKAERTLFNKRINQHNCPCLVEHNNSIPSYPASSRDHIYLHTTPEECATLRVSRTGWLVLWGPQLRQDSNPLPPVDDLIWYLADLQSRQYRLPGLKGLPHELIEDFCGWYERYLDRDQTETRQQALRALRLPGSPGQELLKLAAVLVQGSLICTNHGVIEGYYRSGGSRRLVSASRDVGVTIDEANSRVFISRRPVMLAANRRNLPMPDLDAATSDLVARKALLANPLEVEGWVVSLEAWNEALNQLIQDLK